MVLRFEGTPYADCARVASELRGSDIPCSVYLGDKKTGKQIEHALKEGFTHVVLYGGDEARRGVAKVKDLACREEAEAPLGSLASVFIGRGC
jgi:histidyl-tRNA synthetase